MTLFTKLTLYNTLVRLLLVGVLWLFFPGLFDRTGYSLISGILLSGYLIDIGYIRFLLRPLHSLADRKLRIIYSPGPVDFPPLATTTIELRQLDEHINDLMRRLSLRFECEKAFTAYASHELLTPIAVLRSRFDNLIVDEQTPPHMAVRLVESQQTLLRLSKIIQMLLRLARIENHQYLKNEPVSIRAVLHEVLSDLDDRIDLKEIQLNLILDDDIVMEQANHSLIYTMLLGLVGNAVRYSIQTGRLFIGRGQISEVPTLMIQDSGPGMTSEQVATLTQYGHPVGSSGESTGIGLQLILTIATFHHIGLSVDTCQGTGTRITLAFVS